MLLFVWIVSIIAVCVIADQKGLNFSLYLLLAILLGPIALIIVLAMSTSTASNETPSNVISLQEAQQELAFLKNSYTKSPQRR